MNPTNPPVAQAIAAWIDSRSTLQLALAVAVLLAGLGLVCTAVGAAFI